MIRGVIFLDDEVKRGSLLQHKLSAFLDLIHVEQVFNDPQHILLLQTVVMAALGTLVSYAMSTWLQKRTKK